MAVSVERVGRTPAIYQGDHNKLFFFFSSPLELFKDQPTVSFKLLGFSV